MLDMLLCLALALRIHGTDEAVRATAARMWLKNPPPKVKGYLKAIADAKRPALLIEAALQNL